MRRTLSVSLIFTILALVLMFILIARPFTNAAAVSPATVFTNPASIAINSAPPAPIPASPYPSNVTVSGMTGTTTKISVTLFSMNASRPFDYDMLLVSPTGAKMIIMSDAGSAVAANTILTLDDDASSAISGAITTGGYRPTNIGADDPFPPPAPLPPYSNPGTAGTATFASVFNGADPNGTWSLYIVDDVPSASDVNQRIDGGWGLNVTTTGSPVTFFANNTPIVGNDIIQTAAPYPSTIDVTGMTGIVTDVKLTLNGLTHTRTGDLDVLLVSPNGMNLIVMSDAGNGAANNITVTLDDASSTLLPPQTGSALTTGTYEATNNFAEGDVWPAPATAFAPFNSPLSNTPFKSSFGGFSPNGTWSLYIMDDAPGESGTISGGWSLDITTTPYTPPAISCSVPVYSSTGTVAVGSNPTGIARGDFNNDMKQDLVVANQASHNISVLLGNGMGGFSAATNFNTAMNPYSVAVADFNNDMNQDVAATNQGSNNVSVLLGDGLGGFGPATNYGVGISPISVAVGDFNNDSKPDLAVTNLGGFLAGTVSILLNTGTSFGPATSYGVRTQPAFVAIGEFNGDSNQDLAVANFGSGNLSILTGTGTGAFTPAPTASAGTGPVSIAVGDIDGDGKSDLAVANYNSNGISLLYGTGAATFNLGVGIPSSGANPISAVLTDLNADARPDLIYANSGTNNVRVLYNDNFGNLGGGLGSGTFPVDAGPNALVVGDFNGDNKQDFATANSGLNNVSVLLGGCAVAKGNRFDVNGDRRADFVVFRPSNGNWYSLPSGGSGAILGTSTDKIVPEDYNGDGKIEFAYFRPSTARWVVPGIYNLEFGIATDIPVPNDYDGDGRADIAVYRPSEGAWYIRRSTDNNWMSFLFGTAEDKPVPRDYDGDGKADIAIFRPSAAGWYILRSSDNQVRGVQFGISTDRPVPADYDGDGKSDVAVFRPADSAWYIEKSSDGGFLSYSWGVSGDIPVQGDYDGDGKFDIGIFRPSNGYWFIRLSSTGSLYAQPWGTNGDIPIPSVYIPQ